MTEEAHVIAHRHAVITANVRLASWAAGWLARRGVPGEECGSLGSEALVKAAAAWRGEFRLSTFVRWQARNILANRARLRGCLKRKDAPRVEAIGRGQEPATHHAGFAAIDRADLVRHVLTLLTPRQREAAELRLAGQEEAMSPADRQALYNAARKRVARLMEAAS